MLEVKTCKSLNMDYLLNKDEEKSSQMWFKVILKPNFMSSINFEDVMQLGWWLKLMKMRGVTRSDEI